MFSGLVYIEEDILTHPGTLQILSKLGNPKVVPIKHYKDVFNQAGSDWRLQKAAQKIILAARRSHFYYEGSDITPAFGFKHFYYNTLALNCIYDCDYCYLQGMFSSAHLVLFVNNDDFIEQTKVLLQQLQEPVYLALSYDTDLLAIEHWYPYCKEWIAFASEQTNLTIEIRTKSINIKALQHIKPADNIILAWTLSPQEVINLHEPKTPSAQSRIAAIKKAVEQGWRVRICFDPILHIPNAEMAYMKLVDELASQIQLTSIDSFSLGVFRMNQDFLKRMQHQRKDNALLFHVFEKTDDTVSYAKDIKKKLIDVVTNRITHHEKHAQIVIL